MKEPKVKVIVSGHTHIGKQEIVKRAHYSNVDVRVVETDYGDPGFTMVVI